MIHKVAATILIVHSRHTGSSTPATTTGISMLLLVVVILLGTVVLMVHSNSGNFSDGTYARLRRGNGL